jgi:hypothetical protein
MRFDSRRFHRVFVAAEQPGPALRHLGAAGIACAEKENIHEQVRIPLLQASLRPACYAFMKDKNILTR